MVDSHGKTGFTGIAQVVSLLSAEFLASKDGDKHHMLKAI